MGGSSSSGRYNPISDFFPLPSTYRVSTTLAYPKRWFCRPGPRCNSGHFLPILTRNDQSARFRKKDSPMASGKDLFLVISVHDEVAVASTKMDACLPCKKRRVACSHVAKLRKDITVTPESDRQVLTRILHSTNKRSRPPRPDVHPSGPSSGSTDLTSHTGM